jgi:hypothetical protein
VTAHPRGRSHGTFELCRAIGVVATANLEIADEEQDSLIRAKIALIDRFNSL